MLQTTNRKNDINALLINLIFFYTRIGITHYKRAVLTQEVTDPNKNMRKLLGKKSLSNNTVFAVFYNWFQVFAKVCVHQATSINL